MQITHQHTIIRCKSYLWNIQKYMSILKNRRMSVQLGMANTFGQAIEETANKDTLDSRGHEMIQFKPWSSGQMLPKGRV